MRYAILALAILVVIGWAGYMDRAYTPAPTPPEYTMDNLCETWGQDTAFCYWRR